MQIHKKTALAAAVVLALTGAAHAAPQTAAPASNAEIQALKETVESLRKQIQDLRSTQGTNANALDRARIEELNKQVNDLKAQLQHLTDDAAQAKSAAPQQDGESDEAVQARTPATKADIQGLRTDLENYKYDQSRLQERNIPSVTRNTKIGGSLTIGYISQNPGVPSNASTSSWDSTTPGATRHNGFTPVQVGLNFAGNLYRDYQEGKNLTYKAAFTSKPNTASSGLPSGGSQLNITDAYIAYSYQPQTGNAEDELGTLTLGQQIIPFGQDAQALDPEVKAVINSAGFVNGLGLGTRQIGLVLRGDYSPYVDYTNNYRAPLLAYNIGLVNGNGANQDDNNSMRDWIGRLVYTLPVDYASWLRQLQIGTSYYRGSKELAASGVVSQQKGVLERRGFDVNWTHLPYSISYEWAYGRDGLLDTVANRASNPDLIKHGVGQYVNFGYTWGEQFLNSSKQQGKYDDYWPKSYQAFVRFDQWDPNASKVTARTDNSDRKQYTTTVGLNVFFAETTKFQINYIHARAKLEGADPNALNPASVNGFQAQFNATF